MKTSVNVLEYLSMRNISCEIYRVNQTRFAYLNFFFLSKIMPFMM
jgi:hypothetical protein